MLFKQVLVDAILEGRKTQTRRPQNFTNPRSHYWYERCRYQPGVRFGIQGGRGMRASAYAVVTGLRVEELGAISEEDAIAEGFGPPDDSVTRWSARDEFLRYVYSLYGDRVKQTDLFWVIEFELERSEDGGA